MKQSRFTEEQIAFALKQLDEKLTGVPELSRKMGVCEQTIYNWRKIFNQRKVSSLTDKSDT